ncbi:unnamed protein product [Didymodactylos carnosus]|uniref:Uncharacterized protein n=1 Tax=Didymodactylos carnosus TaxID=1234261 RepID=A0A814Z0U6_9BILA|nr:unnamed protein product [Didymodactylos carnosus]CAF1236619.1 unnamed protein product [Didymodactylos carnosus]CAF3835520.1 unnamed protein product [Didymodactylos carnosus]CAF3998958.1 unnamed protein product [Didymodactylos carnosus]
MSTTRYPDIVQQALHNDDANRRPSMSDQNTASDDSASYPSGQEARRSSLSHEPTAMEQKCLDDWGF